MIGLRRLLREACPDRPENDSVPDIPINGVDCDSRNIAPGFLFVALRGAQNDGADFIADALARGAAAIIAEHPCKGLRATPFLTVTDARSSLGYLASAFYGHPSRSLGVIGITGTNGKTTSSYVLEYLLNSQGKKAGVIGTVNYRFAGFETPARETTPGAVSVQSLLGRMRDAGCDHAVMEVSSHALHQSRVAGVDFRAALFTNLTQDHLDYHGTFERYFESKSRLFTSLRSEAAAVLNADDEWGTGLRTRTKARILSYAIDAPADLRAEGIVFHGDGAEFKVVDGRRHLSCHSPLVGRHNVYNVLSALAVMKALGFDLAACIDRLPAFQGVPGRLERISAGQTFSVFVDFAHTPDGLENVLSALSSYKKRKMLLVFGCGGDRDRGKRPQMAAIAAHHCDFVYVTSDNPRSEDPKKIAQEVCGGFPTGFKDYTVAVDRKKAIRQALLAAREGDLVLLAGKGHEKTQVIGDTAFPFDDKEEALKVLRGT